MQALRSAIFVVVAALVCIDAAFAQALLAQYPIPTPSSLPYGITAGPDGNIWFAESNSNKVGRITTAGVITEFPTLTAGSAPNQITAGPDGNLWATIEVPNTIGRITTAGVVTEFPAPAGNAHVNGITVGADGRLWFAEENANRIGAIATSGAAQDFATPTAGSDPINIALGPDGNVWFTETNVKKIGRITPSGVITEFTVGGVGQPFAITGGPDGNVWFTHNNQGIGRITPAGVITMFPATATGGIVTGPDGNLWFASGTNIGRITPLGVVTTFPGPAGGAIFITVGSDGNLWMTAGNNSIAKFSVTASGPGATTTTLGGAPNPSTVGQSVTFTATVTGSSPTGTVQFKDGAGNLGAPVSLSGGVATLSTSGLTQGTHSITAVYGGDPSNAGSTSNTFSQVVNAVVGGGGNPVPPQNIPTLSQWALGLLMLLLAVFALRGLRRTR